MQLLLGQVCARNSLDVDPELASLSEFKAFQSETAVCLDQCPIEWWYHKYVLIFFAVYVYIRVGHIN